MGILKRDNSKHWYVQLQFNRKTIVRSTKTANRQKALQFERKLREQLVAEQLLGEKQSIPIREAIKMYQQSKSGQSSQKTLPGYIDAMGRHIDVEKDFDKLTNADLDRLVDGRRCEGVSPHTIKHTISVIRGAWNLAKRRHYKVSEVEFPTITLPKHRTRYLSLDEEKRLLKELDPYREGKGLKPYAQRSNELKRNLWDAHDLVILLIDLGARLNEVQTLEWKDINLEEKVLHIWRHKTKAESILHMTDRVYEVIKRRHSQRGDGPYLFTAKDGGPRKYARQCITKAFKRAGLTDIRIHDLRHTTASRLIQNGLSLFEVAQILGHSSSQTTARYAHLERSHVSAKAANVLNSLNGYKDNVVDITTNKMRA
jgi:integrase